MIEQSIDYVAKILESNNYNVRVKLYSHIYDIVANKNKESYLIKIVTDEIDSRDWTELNNLAKTNGIIPLVIQYNSISNRVINVVNVLNGTYSTGIFFE